MRAKIVHVYHWVLNGKTKITPEGASINDYDILIHEFENGAIQLYTKNPGEFYGTRIATRTPRNVQGPLCWSGH